MKYLRIYYYQFLFAYDPYKNRLKHSVKTVIAVLLALGVVLYERQLAAVWVVIPTLFCMMKSEVEIALRQRVTDLCVKWFIAFVVTLVMMLLNQHVWQMIGFFILLSLFGSYLSNFSQMVKQSVIITLLTALLAIRFHLGLADISLVAINYGLSLLILLVVTLVIWPNRLATQLTNAVPITMRSILHYYAVVINDAIMGNTSRHHQNKKLQIAMKLVNKIETIEQQFCDVFKNTRYQQTVILLRQCLYDVVSVEASLAHLTSRANMMGPYQTLQQYTNQLRVLYLNETIFTISDIQPLQKTTEQLQNDIVHTQEQIRESVSALKHDYQHWRQVAYFIDKFNQSLFQIASELNQDGTND